MSFKYHNENPYQLRLQDCVTRAISRALNIDYFDVVVMLYQNGKFNECDDLCVGCYSKLLTHDFKLPCYYGNGKTVQEVAEDFPDKILLIRIDQHLTTSRYGEIEDTWDPSYKIVDRFWIVD